MGEDSYTPAQQSQGGQYILDPELQNYIRNIGQHLAQVSDRPELPYQFVILNNSVPNAWALPGGKISLNRGLLTALENEAELAAVLAHEIVHAAARHGAKGVERGMLLQLGTAGIAIAAGSHSYGDLLVGAARIGAGLISQKYSREQELEADYYGMHYMARAGYDPRAAVTLQEKFVKLNRNHDSNWLNGLFASHPPSMERVDANSNTLREFPEGGRIGKTIYQKIIRTLKKQKGTYDAYDKAASAADKQNLDGAMELIQKALSLENREALFYTLRGDVLDKQHHRLRAMQDYDQAIVLNADYYRPYQQRGLINLQNGKNSLAKRDLEIAYKLLPTADTSYGLGRIASQNNQPQQARQYFKTAASSSSPSGQLAAIALARLNIHDHPENYLIARLRQTANQQPILVITNKSPLVIDNIIMIITILHSDGSVLFHRSVAIPHSLGPQRTNQTPLPISLDLGVAARFQYQISSFHIVNSNI